MLAVIHQILNHHRALEQKWHAKKIKLHQRLALRLFQEDVKQVRSSKLRCFGKTVSRCFVIAGFGLAVQSRRSVYPEKHRHWQEPAEGARLPKEPRAFRERSSGELHAFFWPILVGLRRLFAFRKLFFGYSSSIDT